MVILSHIRSRTSKPDSGEAMALATEAMSECSDRLNSSKPRGKKKRERGEHFRKSEAEEV